jgi:hypothetical protein
VSKLVHRWISAGIKTCGFDVEEMADIIREMNEDERSALNQEPQNDQRK